MCWARCSEFMLLILTGSHADSQGHLSSRWVMSAIVRGQPVASNRYSIFIDLIFQTHLRNALWSGWLIPDRFRNGKPVGQGQSIYVQVKAKAKQKQKPAELLPTVFPNQVRKHLCNCWWTSMLGSSDIEFIDIIHVQETTGKQVNVKHTEVRWIFPYCGNQC